MRSSINFHGSNPILGAGAWVDVSVGPHSLPSGFAWACLRASVCRMKGSVRFIPGSHLLPTIKVFDLKAEDDLADKTIFIAGLGQSQRI